MEKNNKQKTKKKEKKNTGAEHTERNMKGALAAIMSLAAIACLLVSPVSGTDVKCTHTLKRGGTTRSYDLSSLYHVSSLSDSLNFVSLDKFCTYFINVCGISTSGCDRSNKPSVCINTFEGDTYVGGLLSTQTFSELPGSVLKTVDDGISVSYSKGDTCGSSQYKFTLHIICNEDYPSGFAYDADDDNPCSPEIYVYASAGCATVISSGGLGAGGIILIM